MTIKDVAEYSGVSISTISRVLNNHPDVREEVREKVWAAVKELRYVPNSNARDLARLQGDTVGVIVRGVGNPFLISVMHYIESAIHEAGYTMSLKQISTQDDELSKAAKLARSKRLRGIIFLGGRFDYMEEELENIGIPFVCCTFTNTFGNLKEDKYSSVFIDDYNEGYKAVKLLIEKGHKKIAILLDSARDHSISELRYKGYLDALRDAGIEPDYELVQETSGYSMEDAYNATKKLLMRRKDFTALFTVSDSMGLSAIKALHSEGINVPKDCSVIAIDGIEVSKFWVPTLTTLVQPRMEIGKKAVSILMDLINGKPNCHIRLETSVREGETLSEI